MNEKTYEVVVWRTSRDDPLPLLKNLVRAFSSTNALAATVIDLQRHAVDSCAAIDIREILNNPTV